MLRPEREDWHLLYQGELSDAPGRCESFYEYVCYLGEDKWELACLSSNFSGTMPENTQSDKMSTEDLVGWVFWQDAENDPGTEFDHPRDTENENEDVEERVEALGPRAAKLMSIAKIVSCDECRRLIQLRCEGTE